MAKSCLKSENIRKRSYAFTIGKNRLVEVRDVYDECKHLHYHCADDCMLCRNLTIVVEGPTDDLLLLQLSSGVVLQTRDLHLSHNTLYLSNPRLCFFIVLKRDLFVYRDDSLTS